LPTGGNGSSPASRRREVKNAVNVYLGAADRGKVYRGDLPGRTPALPSNQLFWSGFSIFGGTKHPEEAWRFLSYYTGEEGSQVWKDWAIPPVASVAEEAGLTTDPIEGVWIDELNYLSPRAYVFTPFWGETADPALKKALETVLIDPGANVAEVMQQAAQEAQTALDEKLSQ